jgi:hypothetical protein
MAAGLIAGLMAAPADAQRRRQQPRPVPVEVDYFLRNDSDGCAEEDLELRLEEGSDGANCGSVFSGPVHAISTGLFGDGCALPENPVTRICTIVYTATEGIPFLLNANKEITGMIAVSSTVGVSAGPTQLVIVIRGTTDEEVATEDDEEGDEEEGIEIGRAEVDYIVGPGIHEVEFEIEEIDSDLHRVKFETLTVELYNRGAAPLHGHYRVHDPASFITMPTIEMRRRR